MSKSDDTATDIHLNQEEPVIIKPINSNTIHRICSGQVVLSLAIAVKELVENAIDANASSVEVRLKEYGLEFIEVTDNGTGVKEENFQALTLKHYTSKLKQFTDLESISTLGFRGEALSSLCALSSLTITTRHAVAEHGTKIYYDNAGKLISKQPAPRETGTTVTLENLFSSLPVRRKEFTKNIKKEYSKMCQLLYAYCLVSKGIKFTCTNQNKVGSHTTVISTEGSNAVRENIISVFGTKQIQSLVEVDMIEPDDQILSDYKLHVVSGEPLPFNFEFIISSAVHGSGRSTSDRQFFYINERPCEPHKIMKLVNEVYRQFNSHQYPFVFLNVVMERSCIDVNVTPDKRQIFLEKEKLLLATLKTSLLNVFKTCPSTYVSNVCVDITKFNEKGTKRSVEDIECKLPQKSHKLLDAFRKVSKINKKEPVLVQATLQELSSTENAHLSKKPKLEHDIVEPQTKNHLAMTTCETINKSSEEATSVMKKIETIDCTQEEIKPEEMSQTKIQVTTTNSETSNNSTEEPPPVVKIETKLYNPSVDKAKTTNAVSSEPDSVPKIETKGYNPSVDKAKAVSSERNSVTVRASIPYIKQLIESCQAKETPNDAGVRFRSEITPTSNKSAEEELQKQITKDMFKKMHIVGQFNLGFIIAKLENDLFIVDQHATDEKYNFEQLQLHTVMENQVLVNPSSLELSNANEELLIENLDVFQKNGFKFVIDSTAPATKKIKLCAIPISKNYIFGKDDIEEMLFMLQEEVNVNVCRPSRIRSMFASRACRKSVMVGCPLNHSEMKRLIEHMGEIDQPWNCPHGRPTIRHLINLNLLEN